MSSNQEAEGQALASYRTMDIAVAIFLLIICAIVMTDSIRLGIAWKPNEGPEPGLFPFYMAVGMGIASLITLVRALPHTEAGAETMIAVPGLKRMAAIYIPALLFVLGTGFIGIYVSAALYISAFMIFFGKFAVWKAATVSLSISIVTFMMFEVWFLVPLPKGPLEAALGY